MNGDIAKAALLMLALAFAGTASAAAISGKVIRDKQVKLRDAAGSHLVVLVQAEKGRSLAVDLGSAAALDVRRLRGAELMAQGPLVRVGDRAVLMAERASADGKPLVIERSPPVSAALRQYGAEAGAQAGANQRIVSGTVERTKQVARGRRGKNLVVAIRTGQGEVIASDLGPAQLALGEDLNDKPIRVEGQLLRVGDRLVLFADRYRTGNRVVRVERPDRRFALREGAAERVAEGDRTLTLNVGEELLGATVKGGGGVNLGLVEDVVADATGVIRYVLISPSEQVAQPKAVPWHALRKTESGYLLPMGEAQFAEAPTYPPSGDIALADRGWHEETFAYYGLVYVPVRMAFNELDADNSGAISPEEAETNARLLANFGNADANEDGRISPPEFSAFEAETAPVSPDSRGTTP